MNNIEDYSINATTKDGKLLIEYNGKIFKDNPSLITKRSKDVFVKETLNGFAVEINLKKSNQEFSINNVGNKDIVKEQKEPLDLMVIEKQSIFDKIKSFIKKLHILGKNKVLNNEKEIN